MLEERTENASSEKKESIDGQLVKAIHETLFEINEEDEVVWKQNNLLWEMEDRKLIEWATVEEITNKLNLRLPERSRYDERWVGKEIKKLGFITRENGSRKSLNWKKSTLVLDRITFSKVFGSFSLPLPADLHPVTSGQSGNSNDINSLALTGSFQNDSLSKIDPVTVNVVDKGLTELTGLTGSNFPEVGDANISVPLSGQISNFQPYVEEF
ncbi:MAG: hypothetical protein L0220_29185 [Acidobacteria bacterium]|nr:hypothetical protein [Acidobacteriota bacterium]